MTSFGLFLAIALAAASAHTLSLTPTSLVGGQSTVAKLLLAQDVSTRPLLFTVTVSDTSAASAPATVSVPSGSTTVSFPVSTRPVATPRTVTVTAAGASATLNVLPASLTTFDVSAASVVRGQSIKGTVTLNGPAPSGGVVVALGVASSSLLPGGATGITVPPSVTIPAGKTSGLFVIAAERTAAAGTVTITATFRQVSLRQSVRVL
jgi:hypothetical protein